MFSKTCEYAIRAMIFIAQRTKNGCRTGIKEITKNIGAPESFIAKILQDLGKKGLLLSAKGPNGGFYLSEEGLNCSIADIVKAVDGDKVFFGCGLGLSFCSETQPCPIHNEFKKVRTAFYEMLKAARLNDLHEQLEKNMAALRLK